MIVSTSYGVIATPSECTGFQPTSSATSSGYGAIGATLVTNGYNPPVGATSSHFNIQRVALEQWLGNHTNLPLPSNYGPNL
jgi:hypothetical protein